MSLSEWSDFRKRFVVRGKAFDISTPCVMGILNTTPDSFSDGGLYQHTNVALHRIEVMIAQGARIIDVGGESTRPGSDPVSENDEIARTIPILKHAIAQFPDVFFSIDTTKKEVARLALEAGVHFVNDVSGLQKTPEFTQLCAKYEAGLIIMHSKGDPKIMQNNPEYENVVDEVVTFLQSATEKAKKDGVSTIIVDPGIGFGKSLTHNIRLIQNISKIKELGFPVLLGASRKSMLGQILGGKPVSERLAATVATHFFGLCKGVDILRVHDVQEAFDSILVYNALGNENV